MTIILFASSILISGFFIHLYRCIIPVDPVNHMTIDEIVLSIEDQE